MSFLFILVGFLEKEMNLAKSGNLRGPTSRRRDPHAAA